MNKKGSLFVETALILPLFLLAILSICVLIRITAVEENTMRSFAEEAQKIAKEAYLTRLDLNPEEPDLLPEESELIPDGSDLISEEPDLIPAEHEDKIVEGLIHGAIFELRILNRLKEETVSLKDASLNRFEYLYSDEKTSGLIHCGIRYGVELPLPLEFHRQLQFEQRLLFRGFIGVSGDGEGMGFERMETQDDAFTVYVFPRAGERFHQLNCRVIEVYPRETVLSPTIRKQYSPCKICDAASNLQLQFEQIEVSLEFQGMVKVWDLSGWRPKMTPLRSTFFHGPENGFIN
jgi:hypothetical protein